MKVKINGPPKLPLSFCMPFESKQHMLDRIEKYKYEIAMYKEKILHNKILIKETQKELKSLYWS
jgi:hypothetical protein